MKRLNRKGFTLVELLAVIVILAIVVGITMVTILPTLENSRKKSFDVAVGAIKTYIQEQREMALLSGDLQGNAYNSAVATCEKNTTADPCVATSLKLNNLNLLQVTGYDKNITELKWTVNANGTITITCATANQNGDYRQSNNYKAC